MDIKAIVRTAYKRNQKVRRLLNKMMEHLRKEGVVGEYFPMNRKTAMEIHQAIWDDTHREANDIARDWVMTSGSSGSVWASVNYLRALLAAT